MHWKHFAKRRPEKVDRRRPERKPFRPQLDLLESRCLLSNACGLSPDGPEFRVNASTQGDQGPPLVAHDTAGNFVITWDSLIRDDRGIGDHDIFARRYNAEGVAQGDEIRVNSYTNHNQTTPEIAVAPNGNFVVVWISEIQDGGSAGVFAQRYNAAGSADGLHGTVGPVLPAHVS